MQLKATKKTHLEHTGMGGREARESVNSIPTCSSAVSHHVKQLEQSSRQAWCLPVPVLRVPLAAPAPAPIPAAPAPVAAPVVAPDPLLLVSRLLLI